MGKRRIIEVRWDCLTCPDGVRGEGVVMKVKENQEYIDIGQKICVFCSCVLTMTWKWSEK